MKGGSVPLRPYPMKPGRSSRLAGAAAGLSVLLLLTGCGTGGGGSEEASESAAADPAGTAAPSQDAEEVEASIDSGYPLNAVGDHPVVTMFTDYECPACQSAHALVEEAAQSLDGEVTVMVKNYPLPMHDNAVPAARAVEAAAMQGRAVEYADHLYENPGEWIDLSGAELDDYFRDIADDQGLETGRFAADLSSGAVAAIVDGHAGQAAELGLPGTPSFVTGDQTIDLDGVRTADDLAGAFRDAAEEAGDDALIPSGGTAAPTAPAQEAGS